MTRCLLLSILTPLALAQTAAFRAGIARVEITPAGSMTMYGYGSRKCSSDGTHDPLFAKVLVLEAGSARMALVTLDLGSIVSDSLRRRVAAELDIPTVLLAASHTHSGPAFLAPAGTAAGLPAISKEPSPYLLEIEQKIFDAIRRAASSLFPARLGVGRGSLQLGYNRLLLRDDGRARALFDNLQRIPYGPVDPEYVLLRVDDAEGAPRALLVHYAAHSVVLGSTNCKYSADYPGVLQTRVEAAIAGVQCMFVQGGAGDINPLFQGRKGVDADDFAVVETMGRLLADAVVKTAGPLRTAPPERPSLSAIGEVIPFAGRWEPGRTLDVGITTVLLNGDIAIAAVPGEPHHRLQTYWKTHADAPVPLFYGYTYSSGGVWPGYLPDLRTAAYGGYGADVTTSVEIGAAERIMERHRINLYRLRGMWRDKPGLP